MGSSLGGRRRRGGHRGGGAAGSQPNSHLMGVAKAKRFEASSYLHAPPSEHARNAGTLATLLQLHLCIKYFSN